MTAITIPKELESKLQNLKGRAELRTEDGTLVGVFEPVVGSTSADWRATCPYTDAELDALAQQSGGRPLKDILKDLEEKWPSK
jgi:hypothetical protein